MISLFPHARAASAYAVPYSRLRADGFRGIIFDIDNTLVPHGAPADEKSRHLFAQLAEMGFELALISNNDEERVRPFAEAVKAYYVTKAGKPLVRGFEEAMRIMGTTASDTFLVGDQIFTDIWGGRAAGIFSILVNPVDPSKETPFIYLKRVLEKPVLFFYRLRQIRRRPLIRAMREKRQKLKKG